MDGFLAALIMNKPYVSKNFIRGLNASLCLSNRYGLVVRALHIIYHRDVNLSILAGGEVILLFL